MALSRPRRIFTQRKRFPWAVTAVTVFAAAEISYVVYSWDGNSAPGCDAEAVQLRLQRLVEGEAGSAMAGTVRLAAVEEVDRRVSGGATVKRECVAEAAIEDTRTMVSYEIRPDGRSNDYRVVLSAL